MQEILDADGNVAETHEAGVARFHIKHNHWHQADVAAFTLRQGTIDGAILAQAAKVTFCLIDYDFDKTFPVRRSERVYWDCNGETQGISVGWGDEYHHSTPGQSLDITGLPEGIYYLTHRANPSGYWLESNTVNNFSWMKLQLVRKGANPKIVILDQKQCPITDPEDPDYQILCGNTSNK